MHFRIEGNPEQEHQRLTGTGSVVTAGDTIAAISTAVGEGAISLVRVSGPGALRVADKIFHGGRMPSDFVPQMQHFGEIRDGDKLIDRVMLSVHRAPASYTGEHLVEISCHGGILVTARVLELCLRAGARQAGPGEFTERAFLNGKMDLTQAEAVIDLIRAKTDLALRSATEQLEGRLGQQINAVRDGLVSVLANIEAAVDFPEEGISPDNSGGVDARLTSLIEQMSNLIRTADQGRILREGVRVVIYGATNAGKSSLLNRLLGHERVIVSDTHGTTRDTIEETLNLRGYPLRLIDTAGMRSAADEIEREGIARTRRSLQQADLRLQVVDRSEPKPPDFDAGLDSANDLLVLNKSDLAQHHHWNGVQGVHISCLTGLGLTTLEDQILARLSAGTLQPDNPLVINVRHRDCLRRAVEACQRARGALQEHTAPEYVALDIKDAVQAVGEIIGAVGVEQVLDSVFAQFCIGK